MEIRILKYFLTVAREENITRAANLLHITQPTLSRQLIQLEDELGVKLFRRSSHHITLTDDGLLLKRRANKEQYDDSSRPAISGKIENLSDYDTIYLSYPIWWGTMPKIINTFLESYDFSGKTIMPFCTSGGSGIASSVSAIKTECPNTNVRDGLRGTGSTDEEQIKTWAENK